MTTNTRRRSETPATEARHPRHHLSVWMTRAEACEALGCSPRTLARKVEGGELERRQEGRQGLYRQVPDEARRSAPEGAPHATEARPPRQDDGGLLERLVAAERARGHAEGQVEELRRRLAEAEAEVERLRRMEPRPDTSTLADLTRRLERLERRRLVASATPSITPD